MSLHFAKSMVPSILASTCSVPGPHGTTFRTGASCGPSLTTHWPLMIAPGSFDAAAEALAARFVDVGVAAPPTAAVPAGLGVLAASKDNAAAPPPPTPRKNTPAPATRQAGRTPPRGGGGCPGPLGSPRGSRVRN